MWSHLKYHLDITTKESYDPPLTSPLFFNLGFAHAYIDFHDLIHYLQVIDLFFNSKILSTASLSTRSICMIEYMIMKQGSTRGVIKSIFHAETATDFKITTPWSSSNESTSKINLSLFKIVKICNNQLEIWKKRKEMHILPYYVVTLLLFFKTSVERGKQIHHRSLKSRREANLFWIALSLFCNLKF